jgi:ankyrin repeat protein
MTRAPRFLLPIGAFLCLAGPLAAQSSSDGYAFLKAVRDGDGTKVQEVANNPSSPAINARDPRTGESALHILVKTRNLGWIAFLLARGARPDIIDNDGATPLALAAQLGWIEGAAQLLAGRASVDLPNRRGETPLILAVQARQVPLQERIAIVRLLLSQGADPTKQDSFAGSSALDYARQDTRAPDLVRVLETERRQRPAAAAFGPNP